MDLGGRKLTIETGELAKQAGGSALVRFGDNVVLAAVTASNNPREGIDFFPLTVDYEERMYSAGKIPGGYIKREGRPTEHAILSARQIDRPIRPLFPDGFRNEIQVIVTVLANDPQVDSDVLGQVAAGAALAFSDIPFPHTVAGLRVGYVDGEYVVNPTIAQIEEGLMDIVVAGTKDAVMMVEGGGKEISEEQILGAVEFGHKHIKEIIALIDGLAKKVGKPKREFTLFLPNEDLDTWVRKTFAKDVAKAMRVVDKQERNAAFDAISKQAALERLEAKKPKHYDELKILLESSKDFDRIIKAMEEGELRTMVVDEGLRPDGRKPDEIRPIWCKVGYLPRVHGSGVFTRGQTQVMTICTLGSKSDAQRLDTIVDVEGKRYMHFYNFPPYSVGETRPMRGPGRREIGHGHLAERALEPVLPSIDEFPYTLRLMSETLESNGSSSMGSVCGSTLSLMDAGVPIKKHVGGVAMGLILHGKDWRVLTDIQGLEDALGEMDFKVAGTEDGITAIQMDIKVSGITLEIMRKALEQANAGRKFIIGKLKETISSPHEDLSAWAPRMIIVQINPDKIKDVIGPGGKMINKITAETGVKIDIENDGRIFIASPDGESAAKAKKIIESLTKEIKAGEVYLGTVTRIMNFGAFVQILPGKEGLVHISQLSPSRVERVEDEVNIGDEIMVKVIEIDAQNRINLTRKGVLADGSIDESVEVGPPPSQRGGGGGRREHSGSGGGRRRG
ncbi:polyribonucleotide nucleotidyltransferase [bacterium]|nr:MAG: polyribonucleotide nucleotidyltransferase [bacterium]